MNVLMIGKSLKGAFKTIIQMSCPTVTILESEGEYSSGVSPHDPPEFILMSSEMLRTAKRIKSAYPEATLAVLIDHDSPEYREYARRHDIDYLLALSSVTATGIKKMFCPYS